MAFHLLEKFADVSPVAASGQATADLPQAGTYHAFFLHCLDGGAAVSKANIIDNLTNIKLTLDGVNVLTGDAAFFFDLYEQHYAKRDITIPAGCLPIMLSPQYLDNADEAQVLGYGMADAGVMQLELTFSSNVGTVGHTDQIQVFAERVAETRPLGVHKRILKFERSFASTGEQEITDLPIEPANAKIATLAYHIQYAGQTATISNIEVIANNQVVMQGPPLIFQTMLEKAGRKYMVTGAADDLMTIPFDLFNNLKGYLPHKDLNDFRLKITWATAAPSAYTIYRESIHGIGDANA